MSDGKSTCAEIKKLQTIDKAIGVVDNLLENLNPLSWLGNKNKNTTEINNITNLNLSSEDITKILNECENNVSLEQLNKITSGPECIKEYKELCGILSTDENKLTCIKNIPKIENITQSNVATVKSNCAISQIIDKMTQQTPTVASVAKLLNVQEASGLAQKGTNITNSCNEVNQNISSKSFLESINKCVNKVNAKQRNIIKSCAGASKISQSNATDMMNDCLITSGVTTKNIQKPDIKIGLDISSTQKATNTVILAIIAVVIAIVVIVGIIIAIKYYGAKGAPPKS
jgi:hypothetical protein